MRWGKILGTLLVMATMVAGQTDVWLSATPPRELAKSLKRFSMARVASRTGENGQREILEWVRRGLIPASAAYLQQPLPPNWQVLALTSEGQTVQARLELVKGYLAVVYPPTMEQFTDIFLLHTRVFGDTLVHYVAKAERLLHSCRNGHDKNLVKAKGRSFENRVPIEVYRLRGRNENFHFRAQAGSELRYRVFIHGQPAGGIPVTVISHHGWQRQLVTNKDGVVTFKLVQDEVTPLQEFRRYRRTFLLRVDYLRPVHSDEPYRWERFLFTASEQYVPTRYFYSSVSFALLLLILTALVSSLGIWIYRKKRTIDYKEIQFDEKH